MPKGTLHCMANYTKPKIMSHHNSGPKKFYNIGHRAGTKEWNNEGEAVKFKGKV